MQMLTLGALHLVDCAIVYSAVAVAARRVLQSRPRAAVIITKIAGLAMVAIGLLILTERVIALLI